MLGFIQRVNGLQFYFGLVWVGGLMTFAIREFRIVTPKVVDQITFGIAD